MTILLPKDHQHWLSEKITGTFAQLYGRPMTDAEDSAAAVAMAVYGRYLDGFEQADGTTHPEPFYVPRTRVPALMENPFGLDLMMRAAMLANKTFAEGVGRPMERDDSKVMGHGMHAVQAVIEEFMGWTTRPDLPLLDVEISNMLDQTIRMAKAMGVDVSEIEKGLDR